MFYALVKFKGAAAPVLFGTTNLAHAARLATMDDVEWVSPTITGNGHAMEYATVNGGCADTDFLHARITAYTPVGVNGDDR